MLNNQSACGAVVRQSQVVEELEVLAKNVEELIEAVNKLEDRFSGVLSPISPRNEGCDKSSTSIVAFAQAIKDNRLKINNLTNRIREILDRCQL